MNTIVRRSNFRAAATAGCLVLLLAGPLPAAMRTVERFDAYDAAKLLDVTGGRLEVATVDGQTVYRWHLRNGVTSLLSMRPSHPLFDKLRYYDQFQCDFRVVSGDINGIGLAALGIVSGPRQYKVHQVSLALRTTTHDVWHKRDVDLSRPNWMPWDNPDGEGAEGYFRLDAMALAPDTVIELRNVRLVRQVIFIKPFYERPVTWFVKTDNDDGSVTYNATFHVLNTGGVPTRIAAAVVSEHKRFKVAIDPPSAEVNCGRGGGIARFNVSATMSAKDIARSKELYAEPLCLRFTPAHEPDAYVFWQGYLVRPLSKTRRGQVVLARKDIATLRKAIRAGNSKVRQAVGMDRVVARANDFLTKRLDHIPTQGYAAIESLGPWRITDVMPEIVSADGTRREYLTHQAGATWSGYLRGAVENVGMAYLMTGDEKYARKALELFELYGRQYEGLIWLDRFNPPWNIGPNTLSSSRISNNSTYGGSMGFKHHCRALSMIAESPSRTPEAWDAIYRGLVLPFATETLKFRAPICNMTDIANHNVLLLGLAFDDAIMVHQALMRDGGLIRRLGDIDADGFSSEGRPLNYHFAGMAEYLPSITYLANSGLDIAYPKRQLLAAIRMPYLRAALNGRVPGTGDCGRGHGVGPNYLADHLAAIFPDETWLLDIGTHSTLATRLRLAVNGARPKRDAWKAMLDPNQRLFRHAGMAILRTGRTADEQIMLTLDYGRNVFHAALDRNQITLFAFGKMYTHGTGSLYNVGSGGMTRGEDPRLRSFAGHGSLGQNVIMVDTRNQMPAVGELLAWSDKPQYQAAVARVEGIQPGVTHTRGVVLADGIVLLLDRMESTAEHMYDFAYHNFGVQSPAAGWSAKAVDKPLGRTANYENIVEPKRLTGRGTIRLAWDLTNQVRGKETFPGRLEFWQLPVPGGQVYTGVTGMNNANTAVFPDSAPSVFHRVRGRNVCFLTVLEPHKGSSRVRSVARKGDDGIVVTLTDGKTIAASLGELIRKYPPR